MSKKAKSLSIFFPFWNEEKNIEKVVTSAIPIAQRVSEKWEILMIDDGSTDKTADIAQKLEKQHPNVRLITIHPNRGYGAALKTGFENAKYEYIVFTDGDLQFDFNEVTRFLEKIEDADLVIGTRQRRNDSFFRNMLMMLHRIWVFMFFKLRVKDIDCGFKMFRKTAVDEIMPIRSEGAMATTEILAKAMAKKTYNCRSANYALSKKVWYPKRSKSVCHCPRNF